MKKEIDALVTKVDKKVKEFYSLPFNVAPISVMEQKIQSENLKQFIDPEFPPCEMSLFDTEKDSNYPFE